MPKVKAHLRKSRTKTGRGLVIITSLTKIEREEAELIEGKAGNELKEVIRKKIKAMYSGLIL